MPSIRGGRCVRTTCSCVTIAAAMLACGAAITALSPAALAHPSAGDARIITPEIAALPAGGIEIRAGAITIARDGAAQPTAVRALALPNSAKTVVTWSEGATPWYAISLDGRTVAVATPTSYDIAAGSGAFDPLAPGRARANPPAQLAAAPDAQLMIVQFITQPLDEYRAAIENAGGRIRYYLANHAYLVTLDEAARQAVEALPFVRWVGAYQPADKLEQPLREALTNDASTLPARARYSIQIAERGPAMKARLADKIINLGGQINAQSPHSFILEATLTPEQLLRVSAMDEAVAIDRVLPTTEYMDIVRSVGGANYVESVAGFRGEGVRGEVMDGNLLTTHQDFLARPPVMHGSNSGSATHGTSTYGIVFGTGTVNAQGRGLLPMAQGIFADYSFLSDRYAHNASLLLPPYQAVFQSNSWGSCCFYSYTTNAAAMDDNIFDNQILLVQAQANEGSTSSDTIAFAKNIVSVGAVRHFNTASLTDDSWSNAGSIGPAPDGRIKPDLAFWYDSIFTTTSTSTTAYTSGFGGTSAATPITAGHFGLMFQMWASGVFGNTVDPLGTVFSNRPHIATSKALMINTASPYNFTGTASDLTRTHQGWGRADVKKLYDLRNSLFIIDESRVLANLETASYQLDVPAGTPELRATLVWTDPAGVAGSGVNRVNDLNLKVTAPDGLTFYWGNNGLRNGNVSTSGGVANNLDNVENVWVTSPAPGLWTVEVTAAQVNQDGRVETPELDVDFGLVVSGVVLPVQPPACPGDADGDRAVGLSDISVVILNWFTTGAPGTLGDLDNDGLRGLADIAITIQHWGAMCP
ncbi:MAG TPA: S8 family serine peptidase [Phycisphaerales bacterium]|nr:S8 family serine peptidase [Phycisphaerales bacterium]